MRICLQRVTEASVSVENEVVGKIGKGLVLLVGFAHGDEPSILPKMVSKVLNLRIFEDEVGRMNASLLDVQGELLAISQFTLYGDCSKGRRPSFVKALGGEEAEKLYEAFLQEVKTQLGHVQQGRFGAHMQVALINDGPVTILVE